MSSVCGLPGSEQLCAQWFTQLHNYTTTNGINTASGDVNMQERCLSSGGSRQVSIVSVETPFAGLYNTNMHLQQHYTATLDSKETPLRCTKFLY